jgi:tetratricopeptide (TPR) repeat protein
MGEVYLPASAAAGVKPQRYTSCRITKEEDDMAPAVDLVFNLDPGEDEWTVTGPTPESPPHKASNPLNDSELLALLVALRDSVSLAVALDSPEAKDDEAVLEALALRIAGRLTPVLLSEPARQEVIRRMNQVDHGRPRLLLRVRDAGALGDQALALPWELITPAPGLFAVREANLDIVREAVADGAPTLPNPTGPLTVAVTIAAPEDQTRLDYERESFRLQGALTALGQSVAFSDLGGVADFVEVVAGHKASAVHFSGHGLPGELVFEDDYGLSEKIAIDELLRRLRLTLAEPETFPRLFFLASCHGATGSRVPVQSAVEETAASASAGSTRQPKEDLAAALGQGPSTAATLHRSGFVQVIGYFGPVGDELCTRAEEAFYGALAAGKTMLHSAAEARATLSEPLAIDGQRIRYPLGWAQLAVYHRGPDRPLAVPGKQGKGRLREVFRRRLVQVSGLPVLEHGFIGRRALQHEIRRRVEKEGRRLIVLQGLGGLGKTALASQLLSRTFAPDRQDQLILRGRDLEGEADPIARLRAQAEEHGNVHKLPLWEERLKRLREEIPDSIPGFTATIAELRQDRSGLVLYVDNAESLQDGPKTQDPKALGSWKPAALEWWNEMERLAEDGLVLVSTRYGWKGLHPRSSIPMDPMSPADVLRMLDTFESFEPLPRWDRERLARRADGHPRTLEFLDRLVQERLLDQGPGFEVRDPWTDLIEPVLPRHSEEIRADLLLEELWERLTPAGREHAVQVGVLRASAPHSVIEGLGTATGELIRTGVLTRFREQGLSEQGMEWLDRWGLHSLVRSFVEGKTGEADLQNAHLAAGVAYEVWLKEPKARWLDHVEGIHHLHAVGEGDRAWTMVREYALWLRDRARYREALVLLETCEAAGTTGEQLALALVLHAQMRRQLGERSLDLARTLDRALELAFSDEVKGPVLAEYGGLRHDRGEYSQAEDLLRRSVEAMERSVGAWHPEYGVALHELAVMLSSQCKYVEAESLLRRSLEVKEKSFGVSHHSYGASLHTLAGVLSRQGKYVEAESLFLQSLEVKEKSLGVLHPAYATSLHELAGTPFRQGKYVEAESLLRQALEIKEKSLGVSHPSLCMTLMNLAGVLGDQGKAEEGEPFLERVLDIALDVHGPTHPDVAKILNMLAQLQAALDRPEAPETAARALAALEATLGVDHPTTREVAPILQGIISGGGASDLHSRLVAQARAAARRGDLPGAISAQEQAIELGRVVEEGQEALVALSVELFNLAGYYGQARRHEDAVRALEEVVALDERTGHPDLGSDRQALDRARQMAAFSPEEWEAFAAAQGVVAHIASLANQARDGAIAALQGEADWDSLIASTEAVAAQAAEGEADGSPWLALAIYLRAVVALLRGEPVPEVSPAFAEHLAAVEAAASYSGSS